MKHSVKTGISFGLTSGIITTLGLIIGLHSGTHSKVIIIGGIFTIAIADAFSDALGIHIAEESENTHTAIEIWESTLATFAAKFCFAMTFVIPIALFELSAGIWISIVWGLLVLCAFSYYIGRGQTINTWLVVAEHLIIAVVVIFLTNYIGRTINQIFG